MSKRKESRDKRIWRQRFNSNLKKRESKIKIMERIN